MQITQQYLELATNARGGKINRYSFVSQLAIPPTSQIDCSSEEAEEKSGSDPGGDTGNGTEGDPFGPPYTPPNDDHSNAVYYELLAVLCFITLVGCVVVCLISCE